MKKTTLIILLSLSFATMGQELPVRYRAIVDKVATGAMVEECHRRSLSAVAESFADPLFADPEVEGGYYWGSPTEVGRRWDLSVSQEFSFPTVYKHRADIRRLQKESVLKDFQSQRFAFCREAQDLCADLVCSNALVKLRERCVDNLSAIAEVYERRMAAGDCSILDFNRVKMELADAQNHLEMSRAERDMLLVELRVLCSDESLTFETDSYDEVVLPTDFASWFDYCRSVSPTLQSLSNQAAVDSVRLRLAQTERLPRMAVGYASENVVGETFRGATLGLSIPLWNNKGRASQARFEWEASQYAAATAEMRYRNHLQGVWNKAVALRGSERRMAENMASCNSMELLRKALDAGEITLERYLQEANFYNDAEQSLFEVRRELEHAVLELMPAFDLDR